LVSDSIKNDLALALDETLDALRNASLPGRQRNAERAV
jgi:hypothetical protein